MDSIDFLPDHCEAVNLAFRGSFISPLPPCVCVFVVLFFSITLIRVCGLVLFYDPVFLGVMGHGLLLLLSCVTSISKHFW
jgi:hypothetical protein